MYKAQRRTLQKRKDNNKRNGGKNEEEVNMQKRLTVPPKFIHPETTEAQKTSGRNYNTEKKENYSVLDSFGGPFNNCVNIRRSERILNKSTKLNKDLNNLKLLSKQTGDTTNQSLNLSPLQEIHSPNLLNSQNKVKCQNINQGDNKKKKTTIKKSKSIFQEINQLYARSNQNNTNTNFKIGLVNNPNIKYSFCDSLFQQINVNLALESKTILACKTKLGAEIKKVDKLLLGQNKMEKNPKNFEIINNFYIEEEHNTNKKLFRQSEWVYNTPPNQKILPPKCNESQLHPAILCTNQKQKDIFELKPNFNIDTDLVNAKDNILVSNNYMEHTATLNSDIDMQPSLTEKKFQMFNFAAPTLPKTYQRTATNSNDSDQMRKVKHTLENENSSSSLCFESKKRLVCDNSTKFSITSGFNMDPPCSSTEKKFIFLKPANPESVPGLNFNFKNGSKKYKTEKVFQFVSDRDDFM